MKNIQNVLICGIGAIGSIYANKINDFCPKNLKILVDKKRFEKYSKEPKIFNGKELNLSYILPDDKTFKADLIIIATKYHSLNEVVKNIENFVSEDTIIISLINGISSEEILAEKYGWKHVLLSYFIGHSSMREGKNIKFDGVGKIVFGVKDSQKTEASDIERLKEFFDKAKIDYETPDDMFRSYWLKYMLNVSSNQLSAIFGMTFGQMQNNEKAVALLKDIMCEVVSVAKTQGVKNTQTMIDEALEVFNKMIPEGKTSMLQDIEAGRKTEVEMFAGTMTELGKKYNVPTPYNKILKDLVEVAETKNSK